MAIMPIAKSSSPAALTSLSESNARSEKIEIRMSKLETNSNPEFRKSKIAASLIGRLSVRNSSFGFVSSFGFRISSFFITLISLHSFAAPLQPLDPHDSHWTSGFWGDRVELCRTETIPALWRIMDGTNYTQFFQNFRIAAGLAPGRHRGAPFNDGDFYKWLEAASATLAFTNDPSLNQIVEHCIDVIAKAHRADGYIHTPTLIAERSVAARQRPDVLPFPKGEGRGEGEDSAHSTDAASYSRPASSIPRPFQNPLDFEMYNIGHLLTAACVHYRATGRTNFLAVARKAADFLFETFRNPTPELARNDICPSHYVGIIDLYRTTRDPRYLDLAKKLFAIRDLVSGGTDDNQDRLLFTQQTNAMGHAVRANYLYAGAADLFIETRDPTLWSTLECVWTNVVQQKMYITGGCGALYDGASPDGAKDQKSITRVHQAYGRNYQLPNLTAHNETCANIGNVLWNWRMFLATGEARFIDVLELALYNSVLSGVSLDGTNFFYTNPLRALDTPPVDLRWPSQRVPFLSSFCCPPNLARTIAESSGYAWAKSENALWLNLYGGGHLKTKLSDDSTVQLSQDTGYPWNGRIQIRIDECDNKPFTLNLRIPGWTKTATVRINGNFADPQPTPGSYCELRRAWRSGDLVDLDLPMTSHLIEANPFVEETLNQVAIQRGPLIYCLESCDLPKPKLPKPNSRRSVFNVSIPSDIDLLARFDRNLLNGIVLLEGKAFLCPSQKWDGQLYRDLQPATLQPINVRFIPYFASGNRGPSEMTVWLSLSR